MLQDEQRMRVCLQRVSRASVTVAGEMIGAIESGLVVLLGVAGSDSEKEVAQMVDKICGLRIFEDEAGKMNRSLVETGGAMLVVSQFTLLADCRKGRRPSFVDAAPPELAEQLYEQFIMKVRQRGVRVATGRFRAHMEVALVNDGPVTIVLE